MLGTFWHIIKPRPKWQKRARRKPPPINILVAAASKTNSDIPIELKNTRNNNRSKSKHIVCLFQLCRSKMRLLIYLYISYLVTFLWCLKQRKYSNQKTIHAKQYESYRERRISTRAPAPTHLSINVKCY